LFCSEIKLDLILTQTVLFISTSSVLSFYFFEISAHTFIQRYIQHDNKIHVEVQKIIKLIVKVFLNFFYRCRKVGSIGIDREAVIAEVE